MAQTLKAAHRVLAQVGIVESAKTRKPCWPSTALHGRLEYFQNSHLTWSGWWSLTALVAQITPASSGAPGSRCKHSTWPRRLRHGVAT